MDNLQSAIWENTFRPKTINDVILPQEYKNFFNNIVKSKASTNLILNSTTPGSGKTTVAKALAHDLNADLLFLNASDENGIDTIRNTVARFASTMSFEDKIKLVVLDEADGLTPQGQEALRNLIDTYNNNCRFILTCNYIAKIIPALRETGGRTMEFEFDMKKPEFQQELKNQILKRMCAMLTYLKIEFDKNAVENLINLKYPSIRSIITNLQKYYMMNGKIDQNIIKQITINDELTNLILNRHLTEARKYIAEHSLAPADVFIFLMNNVVPNLSNKGDAIIAIAQYETNSNISQAPEIQIAACIFELIKCI